MLDDKAVLTGKHLMMGNSAMVEGALAAGCKFFAGYPITPQNEVPERMSRRLPEVDGIFLQMEDEIASIAAIIGASIAGTRAMTSTSGPGFSLMQECMSWAACIELPIVVGDVQRTGPGSGIVSLPHHGDIMQARFGGNGDYEVITLAPSSCQELFEYTFEAFNLADKWRTPVVVLSDSWLGHTHEKVIIPSKEEMEKKIVPREKGSPDATQFFTTGKKRYTKFKIPPTPQIGTPYFPRWLPSVTHSEMGIPVEDGKISNKMVNAICKKITNNEDEICMHKEYYMDDAEYAIIAYGIPVRTGLRAVRDARKEGIKIGLLKLITVWPFPSKKVQELAKNVKHVFLPEINLGQLLPEVERVVCKEGVSVTFIPQISKLHEPKEIMKAIQGVTAA